MSAWEVHAVKYAARNARSRADSFLFDDNHDAPHAMDYYIWVLRRGDEVLLVDTGYDDAEAQARGRPIELDPRAALKPLGLAPEAVSQVIVTHLHYDHAGGAETVVTAGNPSDSGRRLLLVLARVCSSSTTSRQNS